MIRRLIPIALGLSSVILLLLSGSTLWQPTHLSAAFQPTPIEIAPSDDAAQIVSDPANVGATFHLREGVYFWRGVVPQAGQAFIGAGSSRTILTGALPLTNWQREGDVWFSDGQTQQGVVDPALEAQREAVCSRNAPRCLEPEDVFFDNRVLRHEPRLDGLASGEWHFDYARDRIYVFDNPIGRRVQTSVHPFAFRSSADDVTIRDLYIEKFATPVNDGAIHNAGGANWHIENVAVFYSHSTGLVVAADTVVRNSRLFFNGQRGIAMTPPQDAAARAGGIVIDTTEIAFNNYDPDPNKPDRVGMFNASGETGGAVFSRTLGLRLLGNYIHHNGGRGVWTVQDNRDAVIAFNLITLNTRAGIVHETSQSAVIENNVVMYNGRESLLYSGYDGLYFTQILLHNASEVLVRRNKLVVSTDYGSGMGLRCTARGGGLEGEWRCDHNHFSDNFIVFLGARGTVGLEASHNIVETLQPGNNRFSSNRYYAEDGAFVPDRFLLGTHLALINFQGKGFDGDSRLIPRLPDGVGSIPPWPLPRTASDDAPFIDLPFTAARADFIALSLLSTAEATSAAAGTPINTPVTVDLDPLAGGVPGLRAEIAGMVGSVQFVLDGQTLGTVNAPPYVLPELTTRQASLAELPAGSYALTVTAYTDPDGLGDVLGSVTLRVTIVEEVTAAPPTATPTPTPTATPTPTPTPTPTATPSTGIAITTCSLVDAAADVELRVLRDGDVIPLPPVGASAYSIRCDATVRVRSVRLSLSGPRALNRVENAAPFALGSNQGRDFFPVAFAPGDYTLRVTGHTGANAGGTASTPFVLRFTVVQAASSLAAPGQAATPTPAPTVPPPAPRRRVILERVFEIDEAAEATPEATAAP